MIVLRLNSSLVQAKALNAFALLVLKTGCLSAEENNNLLMEDYMPKSQVGFSITHDVKNDILKTAERQLSAHGIQFISNILNGIGVDEFINNEDGIAVNIKSIDWNTELNHGLRLIHEAISNNPEHGRFARIADRGLIRELFGEYQKVKPIDIKWVFASNGTEG